MLFGFKIITPYRLAQVCQQAYSDQPAPLLGCGEFLSKSVLNDHGYSGVAYLYPTESMVIIAHAATDPLLLSMLLGDATLLPSHLLTTSLAAKDFSARVRKSISIHQYTVIETGHLLGAFHAEMNVALLNSGYAATFESPGISEMCEVLAVRPDCSHFMGFFSQPTVLNTAKTHLGSLHRIYTYHMEESGRRKGDAEIQTLTQRLAQLALPLDPSARVGDRIPRKLLTDTLQRPILSAQLEKLLQAMHPHIGYPLLWRHLLSWPTLTQCLTATGMLSLGSVNSSLLSPCSSSSSFCVLNYSQDDGPRVDPTSLVNQNQLAEQQLQSLPGYQAGEFIVLSRQRLEHCHPILIDAYYRSTLAQFDGFYGANNLLRDILLQQLNIPELAAELAISPVSVLPSPARVQSSSSFFSLSAIPPLREAVLIANSLLGERSLVMEGKWLISLVKKIDSTTQMFLLLEGIREGIPIHLRTDFWLDLNTRAKIISCLRQVTSSVIAMVWSVAEELGEYGFVHTTLPSAEEYEKTWGSYQYQSWSISEGQAEQFMTRLVKELHNKRSLSDTESLEGEALAIQPYDSIEWGQKLLAEIFNINTTLLHWSSAKRPTVLARTTTGTLPLLPQSLLPPNFSRMPPSGNALLLLRSILGQSEQGLESGISSDAPPFPPRHFHP